MNEKTAYPLTWPDGRARTPVFKRKPARFDTKFAVALNRLINEIRLLGGQDMIFSSDIPLKQDGLPFANVRPKSGDPGIAVYFTRNKKQLCFACDCYHTPDDNLHAVVLTVAALRGIARWGTGDMMEAAFRGFAALPESTGGDWWSVLGVPVNASREQVLSAFRAKARAHHADTGDSDAAAFQRAVAAWDAFEAGQNMKTREPYERSGE